MRRSTIWLSLVVMLLFSFSVMNAATEKLAISQTIDNTINTTASIQYLTDNDLNTVWEADSNATARAEIRLEQAAVIEGIQLYGAYQGELTVEYWDGSGWRSFLASHLQNQPTSGWNLLDLSYDRIATDRIRLVIADSMVLPKLGGIKEIKVLGEPVATQFQRLEPVAVTGSRTDSEYPAEYLFDHNTYTAWQVKAGKTAAQSVVDLGATCSVDRINVFGNSGANGYQFQYLQDGQWCNITGMTNLSGLNRQTGWQSFELKKYGIKTAKLRLVMTGNSAMSGPCEIEVWGYREHEYRDQYCYLSSGATALSAESPANYAFTVSEASSQTALLHVVADGNQTAPVWELDGQTQGTLTAAVQRNGKTFYQQEVSADVLGSGEHFVRITGKSGNLLECRLEWINAKPLPNTPLTDRCSLTQDTNQETIVDLGQTYHIDELMVKFLDTATVRLKVAADGTWADAGTAPTYRTGEVGGAAVYSGLGKVDY